MWVRLSDWLNIVNMSKSIYIGIEPQIVTKIGLIWQVDNECDIIIVTLLYNRSKCFLK